MVEPKHYCVFQFFSKKHNYELQLETCHAIHNHLVVDSDSGYIFLTV